MTGQRLVGAVVVAVALASAGCSGAGDDPGRADPPPAAPAPVPGTGAPSFSGAGSDPFCAQIRGFGDRFGQLLVSREPDAARAFFTSAQEAVSSLAELAPAEIRADMTVLVGAFQRLLDDLRAADFDVARLPPAANATFEAPEVRTAGTRLDAYKRQVCGEVG